MHDRLDTVTFYANLTWMEDIRNTRRWLAWKITSEEDGRYLKTPFNPETGGLASCNDPGTWTTYDIAKAAVAEGKYDSVGLALGKELGVTIVDLDKVRNSVSDPWPEWALELVEELDSYTEISASGRGLHVLVEGEIPANINRQSLHVELHDCNKMFAISENIFEGRGVIREREMAPLYNRVAGGKIGPDYKPLLVLEAYSSDKYRDIIADDWGKHGFDSRSAAVASALVTLAYKHKGDHEAMRAEFERTPLCVAWEVKGKWTRLGDREIERAIKFAADHATKTDASEAIARKTLIDSKWFFPVGEFLAKKLEPRKILVTDHDQPFLLAKSQNEIYAYRGDGKSMFRDGLCNILLTGGEFLRYKSKGGHRVLLVDAELPAEELQGRLKQFASVPKEDRKFWYMSPENMPDFEFPALSAPAYQDAFIAKLEEIKPDVIIFDTLTACFKYNTMEGTDILNVNRFLNRLRFMGKCVIVVHHAGKNGSQRGRTDVEDNFDLVVKLQRPKGWEASDALRVDVRYEKVRFLTRLEEFTATVDDMGVWKVVRDEVLDEIKKLLAAKKSERTIAKELEISRGKVQKYIRLMKESGEISGGTKTAAEGIGEGEEE